ncbi:MAG: hypothetical protein MUF19_04180 [Candidatus Pacebacteria bacterium]|jgi:hypothetical protein|nr:hypothetical protein [Candidatus Paceibacterota bacterium]
MPYVPIIAYAPNHEQNPLFGYELWPTHPRRGTPYILYLTSDEYTNATTSRIGHSYGKMVDPYTHIHPLALYASNEEALAALTAFMPVRSLRDLDATL